jgi:hypothetical protein
VLTLAVTRLQSPARTPIPIWLAPLHTLVPATPK